MQLKEVCKKTNLTKKAIHYYIDEGLINPKQNEDNSYYEFSNDDLHKLELISLLRSLSFSIEAIKDIFKYPTQLNVALAKQAVLLQDELFKTANKLATLTTILNNVTPNATYEDLDTKFVVPFDDSLLKQLYSLPHARIVAIMVWAPFMFQPFDNYRKYIWEQMSQEFSKMPQASFTYLTKIIYHLSGEQIKESSLRAYQAILEIVEQDEEYLVNYLKEKLLKLVSTPSLIAYWELLYEPVIEPVFKFNEGPAKQLMLEYSNVYGIYDFKMIEAIKQIEASNWTSQNEDVKTFISKYNYHYVLYFIISFENSMYTALPLEELKAIINEKN